ncbi:ComF family protein [Paenibacillus rigui]|uniref:ComF family protein n=1 Tax=Paenibacillus rigui TaxID=554312 RepID=UPI001FEB9489|nr:ComF family protein [Paenibacillus rigui]
MKRNELSLCEACRASIPWILDVKCSYCGRPESCTDCRRREHQFFTQSRSAVSYNPQMKEWLALYKYRGHEKLRDLIGTMLLHAYHLHKCSEPVPSGTSSNKKVMEFFSYVPLSQSRLTERGFNQAQQMAEELARRTGVPVLPLLERMRHTDKQSFKTRGDRLADLQGVFKVIPASMQKLAEIATRCEVRVYLIDDVYTTGSTLNECSQTLLTAGTPVQIYGICWAR